MKTLGLMVAILALIAAYFLFFKSQKATLSQPPSQPSPTITKQLSIGEIPSIPLKLQAGFVIHVFAKGLHEPRDLQFSPGGTLLVSDPQDSKVYALPDKNNDG